MFVCKKSFIHKHWKYYTNFEWNTKVAANERKNAVCDIEKWREEIERNRMFQCVCSVCCCCFCGCNHQRANAININEKKVF